MNDNNTKGEWAILAYGIVVGLIVGVLSATLWHAIP